MADKPPRSLTFDPNATLSLSDPGPVRVAEAPEVLGTDTGIPGLRDLGPLGEGGMGEVRRVYEEDLHRELALKVLHDSLANRPHAVARFIDEAQITAQLQHPNLAVVYRTGRLDDGRPWFTMREVRGRTLREVLRDVHRVSGPRWEATADGWSLRRLVSAFLSMCHGVAYAHDRGVIHRDLKPENVMVGERGQVHVIDWGLAKPVGVAERVGDDVVTDRLRSGSHKTRIGHVSGTPAYMPPEQATGEIDRIDRRSDVYALGSTLYEILSGVPPYRGEDSRDVVEQVVAGPPEPLGRGATAGGPPAPAELVAVCERAMAREQDDRFDDAGAMAAEISAWLDGARKREQALAIVDAALARRPEVAVLTERANALRDRAALELESIEPWRPEEDKAPAWALQDEAAALLREAARADVQIEQGLQAALRVAPDLEDAHAALAEGYRREHAAAEARRHTGAATDAEIRLSEHLRALPPDHPTKQLCTKYLRGDGAVTLVTDPPGATVHLFRYETRNRRLVPVDAGILGTTPLRAHPLPMGSYLCVLRHPDCDDVRYPVHVPRGEHWHGVPPDEVDPAPVWLPERGRFGPDEVYIPGGWFHSGGDDTVATQHPTARLWCDDLVVQRHPVTNEEYLAFLNDLVASGRQEEALRYAPRERGGSVGALGALLLGVRPDGRFFLREDHDGDPWLPDVPVCYIDWPSAAAHMAWKARKTGRPWRLLHTLEWERAARGADSRWFPWGDVLDPSWACIVDSHRARRGPVSVHAFPIDESVYGVRGMGGNMRDWCHNTLTDPVNQAGRVPAPIAEADRDGPLPALRCAKGGNWLQFARVARVASMYKMQATNRNSIMGARGGYRPVR